MYAFTNIDHYLVIVLARKHDASKEEHELFELNYFGHIKASSVELSTWDICEKTREICKTSVVFSTPVRRTTPQIDPNFDR